MKKDNKKALDELDGDLFSGLSPVPDVTLRQEGLDNEIKWKEPGEHAYDGSTINREHLDPDYGPRYFKPANPIEVDKYGVPQQEDTIEEQLRKSRERIMRLKDLQLAKKAGGDNMLDRALNQGDRSVDEQQRKMTILNQFSSSNEYGAVEPRSGITVIDLPTNTIHLIILGEPKAQKRHRSVNIPGVGVRQYDPSASSKKDLLHVVQQQAPKEPLNCPINLKVDFYFTRPKAHFRTGKNAHLLKDNCPIWHLSKPDADNCFKMISDALNKVFWRDDSLICQAVINKRYDLNPRIEVFITPL